MRTTVVVLSMVLLTGSTASCRSVVSPDEGGGSAPTAGVPASLAAPLPSGMWRGVLQSPGGPLPFGLWIPDGEGAPEVINAEERFRFDRVRRQGDRVVFEVDVYDAVLEAELREGELVGRWRKRARHGESGLPFTATLGYRHRFAPDDRPAVANAPPSVAGVWAMAFVDDDGRFVGQAELEQREQRITGTILTPTGDYRYLDGDYVDGHLRLSTFDGAHAFLFRATLDAQGNMQGDFWSRDTYHARFTARSKGQEEVLPDPLKEVSLKAGAETFRFNFPDVKGRMVSSDDPRFQGRVVVVEVFGTWCPNCNDLAPLLAEWHREYRGQGLEVVGLAYEFTDDVNEANERLKAYAARHRVEYPLLRAGISDKDAASATLPTLERIKSYPTTIFIGRNGRVSQIHSGFAGPATGRHYERTKSQMKAEIERLLRVAPPQHSAAESGHR